MPVEDETNRVRPTAEITDREHVRIGLPLPDNQPATRLQHPMQLTQRPVPIGDLAQGGDQERGVERRGREWEVTHVSLGGNHVRGAYLSCPAHQLVEHRLLQIEHVEPAIWNKL